jgi:hypothetical protein
MCQELSKEIKDSGDRTEFATGAVRDLHEGKGRFDLIPLDIVSRIFNKEFEKYNPVALEKDLKPDYVYRAVDNFKTSGNVTTLYVLAYCFIKKLTSENTTQGSAMYKSTWEFMLDLAIHYENGAKKYGENNWQKGIPVHCCIDSALRHYTKYRAGMTDEPHHVAFIWNIITAIYAMEQNREELDDYTVGTSNTDESYTQVWSKTAPERLIHLSSADDWYDYAKNSDVHDFERFIDYLRLYTGTLDNALYLYKNGKLSDLKKDNPLDYKWFVDDWCTGYVRVLIGLMCAQDFLQLSTESINERAERGLNDKANLF